MRPSVKQLLAELLVRQVAQGKTTAATAWQVWGLLEQMDRRRLTRGRLASVLGMMALFVALLSWAAS